jgi:hypothetical protein
VQTGILVATFALAALVVGLYVWFVAVRYRAEKRRKGDATRPARPTSRAPLLLADPPDVATPAPPPEAQPEAGGVATALAGIRLPCDLVPLTNIADRPDVADRVAFVTTGVPAETVGTAFANEVERLGYELIPLGEDRLQAEREGTRIDVAIHPFPGGVQTGSGSAFPTAPEGSVVVEVWIADSV